jgi:hypothetical protein
VPKGVQLTIEFRKSPKGRSAAPIAGPASLCWLRADDRKNDCNAITMPGLWWLDTLPSMDANNAVLAKDLPPKRTVHDHLEIWS